MDVTAPSVSHLYITPCSPFRHFAKEHPKRHALYHAVAGDDLDALRNFRAYWNTPFCTYRQPGYGEIFTIPQLCVLLQRDRLLNYVLADPVTDVTVRSSPSGWTLLMIACAADAPLGFISLILQRATSLDHTNALSVSGSAALDCTSPKSNAYVFLRGHGALLAEEIQARAAEEAKRLAEIKAKEAERLREEEAKKERNQGFDNDPQPRRKGKKRVEIVEPGSPTQNNTMPGQFDTSSTAGKSGVVRTSTLVRGKDVSRGESPLFAPKMAKAEKGPVRTRTLVSVEKASPAVSPQSEKGKKENVKKTKIEKGHSQTPSSLIHKKPELTSPTAGRKVQAVRVDADRHGVSSKGAHSSVAPLDSCKGLNAAGATRRKTSAFNVNADGVSSKTSRSSTSRTGRESTHARGHGSEKNVKAFRDNGDGHGVSTEGSRPLTSFPDDHKGRHDGTSAKNVMVNGGHPSTAASGHHGRPEAGRKPVTPSAAHGGGRASEENLENKGVKGDFTKGRNTSTDSTDSRKGLAAPHGSAPQASKSGEAVRPTKDTKASLANSLHTDRMPVPGVHESYSSGAGATITKAESSVEAVEWGNKKSFEASPRAAAGSSVLPEKQDNEKTTTPVDNSTHNSGSNSFPSASPEAKSDKTISSNLKLSSSSISKSNETKKEKKSQKPIPAHFRETMRKPSFPTPPVRANSSVKVP